VFDARERAEKGADRAVGIGERGASASVTSTRPRPPLCRPLVFIRASSVFIRPFFLMFTLMHAVFDGSVPADI